MAGFFTGLPEQTKQFQRFTPQQQGVQSQALQNALSLLQKNGNQFDFAPIEQQARRSFSTKTIPGIAERFSSLGAQNSSAFKGALGQAGSDLETNLAALRSQHALGQQGIQNNQLNNLLSFGLQPSFENLYQPETLGALGGAAQGVGQGIGSSLPLLLNGLGSAGTTIGTATGNPLVAAGGAGLSALSSLISYLRGTGSTLAPQQAQPAQNQYSPQDIARVLAYLKSQGVS